MRARQLTKASREAFLREYAQCGIIGEAARRIGIDRDQHYRWLEKDANYKKAFELASNQACDRLVEEARRRAHDGAEEPIVYQGEIQYKLDAHGKPTSEPVTVRRYSDNLLMFLIKGMRPEVYRDNWKGEIQHTGTITHRNPDLARLTLDQLKTLEAIALQASQQPLPPSTNGHGKLPQSLLGSNGAAG